MTFLQNRIPPGTFSRFLTCGLLTVLSVAFGHPKTSIARGCLIQEPSLQEILESFKSDDSETRLAAIEDVEYFDLKNDSDRQLVVAALRILLEDPAIENRLESVKILNDWDIQNLPSTAIALDGLGSRDHRVRAQSLYFLSSLESASNQITKIEQVLHSDPEPNVRTVAAHALGELGPDHKSETIPGLEKALADPDHRVRRAAAESLAAVDGPLEQAVSTLVQLIKAANADADDDFPGGLDTVATVERIGVDASATIPDLIESLKLGGTHRQCSVANALAAMGPIAEPAMEALGLALRNGETVGYPFVHRSWCASDDAAKAMVAIGEKTIPILIDALDDTNARVRANAANALGDLPSSAKMAMPKLIQLLRDEDPSVRALAAWAMGKFGKDAENGTPELVRMLFDDTDWESAPAGGGMAQSFSVPWHAVKAIARINPDEATLVRTLKTELSRRETINFAAATVIAKIGTNANSLSDQIQPLLNDDQCRAAAAYAVAHINPDAEGLPSTLTASLIDDTGEIDRVAARGLLIIGERAKPAFPNLYAAIEVARNDEFVGGNSDLIFCALAILFADINQVEAIDALLEALNTSHSAFDQTAIDTATELLPQLAAKSMTIRERLTRQLSSPNRRQNGSDPSSADESEWTTRDRYVQLRSAKILQDAGLDADAVVPELIAISQAGKYHVRGKAVELLGLYGAQAEPAVVLIGNYLDDEKVYTVGGDFYGNGGQRMTVARQSIKALAAIGPVAIGDLITRLGAPNHIVRANAVEALSQMGDEASPALASLIPLVDDPSHRVRRNLAVALGKIKTEDSNLQ